MAKTRLAVIFGSRSVEHEVSIITAHQIMAAADAEKYELVPIYITKQGEWLTGPALIDSHYMAPDKHPEPSVYVNLARFQEPTRLEGVERVALAPAPSQRALVRLDGGGLSLFRRGAGPEIDVVFPAVHGTHGEDGTLQGLLELADLPYVGAGVAAAAVGMDKLLMKAAFQAAGLPVVAARGYTRAAYQRDPDRVLDEIEAALGYPAFVKPAVLGSSIGVARAGSREDLRFALEVACSYGRRVLVERAVEPLIEVNCAVLGNDEPIPSVCEQPIPSEGVLSFADKYLRGAKEGPTPPAPLPMREGGGPGMAEPSPAILRRESGPGRVGQKGAGPAGRLIPAPISEGLTARIQALAVAAFRAIDGAGVARVDFLVSPDEQQVYVNEINTMPGSLSFYLWEPSGVSFPALVDRLVALALERHADKQRTTYSYETDLLQRSRLGGKRG
ncbi:MAG TPA: D-alanine--D-alanine ligase family protein [Chloroflexota bacterium]|nr:D-alanine--D-alanine ligase family protein [Chloroflexota bacterium]